MTLEVFIVIAISLVTFALSSGSSSRVILLEGAKTNSSVIITTDGGEVILDTPNTYTDLSSTNKKPNIAQSIDPETLQNKYGALIQAAPKPPISFLIYFEPGSTTVTPESQQLLSQIELAIKERTPCDVSIIGHADKSGSSEYNIKLSLKRAQSIDAWLKFEEVSIEDTVVESYGEEDPLIPTADDVAEPKNRRVEILIR